MSSSAEKVLYPHPKEGGLNETIVRSFLGQLGEPSYGRAGVSHPESSPFHLLNSRRAALHAIAERHPPRHQAAGESLRFPRSGPATQIDLGRGPQNLLLQPATASELAAGHPPGIPVLKVADFGFARWLPSQSMAETLCGSP